MKLPAILQNKIIDFLKSLSTLHDSESQRAFIYHAGLDPQLQQQIPFGKPPAQFVPFLISILLDYERLDDGRYALEAILHVAKDYIGQDRKKYCDDLIQELQGYLKKQQQETPEIPVEKISVIMGKNVISISFVIIFFVGLLLGLLFLNPFDGDNKKKYGSTPSPKSTSILIPPPTITPTPQPPMNDCWEQYVYGIPTNRIVSIEVGDLDRDLRGLQEKELIAMKFQENDHWIGAMKFSFSRTNQRFLIDIIVDNRCQSIEQYKNVTRGVDKHIMYDYDSIEIQFGEATYTLNLGYDAGAIEVDFFKI